MSLYDIEKLVSQTRKLCVQWHAQGKTTGMTGEIAAFDAAKALNLKLCHDNNLGYTAIGQDSRAGLRILVKGRAIFKQQKSRQRLGQLNLDQAWDLLLLVLLNDEFMAQEIYQAERAMIETALKPQSGENRKGAMSVAKFKVLSTLVWTAEQGEINDEIWDNSSTETANELKSNQHNNK